MVLGATCPVAIDSIDSVDFTGGTEIYDLLSQESMHINPPCVKTLPETTRCPSLASWTVYNKADDTDITI